MDAPPSRTNGPQRRALLAAVVCGAGLLLLTFVVSRSPSPTPRLQIPSPRASSIDATEIRVALTDRPVGDLTIRLERSCKVRLAGSDRVLATLASGERIPVRATEHGVRIGNRELPATRLELLPRSSPGIWIGQHRYRGRLRILRKPGGKLVPVNVLPLDEYLASVVDAETPAKFARAARRAQAIVARTYALYQIQVRGSRSDFDVYASTRSQKYLGHQYRTDTGRLLAGESAASRAIVRDTAGIVCTYRGRIFCTYYTAVCGGRTTRGRAVFSDAAPPLQSVRCDWCRHAERYRWTTRIPQQEVNAAVDDFLDNSRATVSLKSLTPVGGPQPPQFQIAPGRNIDGEELRRLLSTSAHPLYSPRFTANREGTDVVFLGRGHGHGVGLCQWGADGQAKAGKSTLDILRHYYPGCRVVRIR